MVHITSCALEADYNSNGEDDAHVDSISSAENEDPAADDDVSDGGASLASSNSNREPVYGENEGEDYDDGD